MEMTHSRQKAKAPNLKITDPVVLELWVKAAGRCEFLGCNKYLLQDDVSSNTVRLADIAHIVARSFDGPRGNDALPIEDRNSIDNLMLVCLSHHRMIDKKSMVKQFPKEALISYKREHEERVRYLTNFNSDNETVVVRLTSKIRGNSIIISKEHIRESVLKSAAKYPRYMASENAIEINLCDLPDEDAENYWNTGKAKIEEVVNNLINPGIGTRINHLSVFAFSRISFLIYLGYLLGDKVPTDFYQKQKNENEGWIWPNNNQTVTFQFQKVHEHSDASNFTILLSLSGKINLDSLPSELKNSSIYEISPIGIAPNRGIISSKFDLESFRHTYQQLLRYIESNHDVKAKIHLVPASPITAALICGREILREITPSILVYEKIGDYYKPTIKIN